MLRHSKFYAMIGYANYFMIIFLNINLNVRNERKRVIKLRRCTYKISHIVDYHTWYQLNAKTFYYTQYSLCEIIYFLNLINININIRNERKNVEKIVGSTSKFTLISSFICSRQ